MSRSRARKEYWCKECYWKIAPGERYVRIDGKWDGQVSTLKLHLACHNLYELTDSLSDDCVAFGEVFENVREIPIHFSGFGKRLWWNFMRNVIRKRRYLREKEKIAS